MMRTQDNLGHHPSLTRVTSPSVSFGSASHRPVARTRQFRNTPRAKCRSDPDRPHLLATGR
jgi:hypothetical protein